MFRLFAHLQRNSQSGIFHFRLTVPERLRHIVGRREIKKSLRTGVRSEAIVLAQKCYYDAQVMFLKAERWPGNMNKKDAGLEFIKKNAAWSLGEYCEPQQEVDRAGDGTTSDSESNTQGERSIGLITIQVNGSPVSIDFDNPEKELEAAAKLLGMSSTQAQSSPVKQVKAVELNDVRLAGMIRNYMLEKKRAKKLTEKSASDYDSTFTLLKEVLKNPSVSTISHKQANEFKSTLLKLPANRTKGKYAGKSIKELLAMRPSGTMSVCTVNKYLRRVSSLFEWGRKHGYAFENPFSGIGIPEKRQAHEQRPRFTEDDLKILFDPKSLNRDKFKHSYSFWLPYLGLYTGARIEELCQLHLDDIRQVDGVWVLDLNDYDEKKLKTLSSRRLVPVHPRLIELGLFEHVESLRRKGADRLFPELKKQRDGFSQAASKWFIRYREKHRVGKTFHSFRHTFIDELKQLDVDDKKISALVGHKDESMTTGRYGKPYKPEILYPAVCMLDFGV